MAKGHRSQIKRLRNENKDTRPKATVSYARVSVTKACFVLDAIRGKDVTSALGIRALALITGVGVGLRGRKKKNKQ